MKVSKIKQEVKEQLDNVNRLITEAQAQLNDLQVQKTDLLEVLAALRAVVPDESQ